MLAFYLFFPLAQICHLYIYVCVYMRKQFLCFLKCDMMAGNDGDNGKGRVGGCITVGREQQPTFLLGTEAEHGDDI
jgi:hypothetical protein